ncbi:GNAT family N-acetyltransferase [Pelagibius litoralis]|uniref:GNAT family N-acetyltransferase n=1 Tax=Pelagibius litoralis TaxID=374515 RepID=A0A967F1F7_9PROT|nr:GNAT family N-acetyltransferase [Pelagibius litoralis]NIA71200.1 GNAT family N-acetyltransferase [Pelagibius litoralis]
MTGRVLRPARPAECGALTALVLRSKAYWGYDPGFLQACRRGLAVKPRDIAAGRVVVLVEEDTVLGLYALIPDERPGEALVDLLFVEPAAIGHGIGRALWQDLLAKAAGEGFTRLKIESDPFALGFYRAMGATLSGKIRSPIQGPSGAERFLPLLYYEL